MNVTRKLCHQVQSLRNFRSLYTTRLMRNAYEAPGKTTVTFISKEIGSRLLVSNYDESGFVFNTGARVVGPIVLFSRYAVGWNVNSGKDINEGTLSLFTVLQPKPDIVVIGLDNRYDFAYYNSLEKLFKKLGITADILPVHHACSAFNFMNEEGRNVVAALIPPMKPSRVSKMLPETKSREQITSSSDTSGS